MKKIILFLTFLSFVAAAQNQPVSFKKNDAEKKELPLREVILFHLGQGSEQIIHTM